MIGSASRQWSSPRRSGLVDAKSSRGRNAVQLHDAARHRRQPHRDGVLGEAHDAEVPFAGNAFITFAVEQRDHLDVAAFRIGMSGALRERDLEHVAARPLHEHAAQRAIRVRRLRVHHGTATAEGAELAGADGRELPGAQRLIAEGEHASRGGGRNLQGDVGQQCREHQGERDDRHHHDARAGAAGLRRGHLAVVVQPAERQHHSQQQGDRQDHRQAPRGPEKNELEHHAPGITAFGCAL